MPQDKTVMIYDGEYGYHYDLSEALETSDPQTSEEIVEVF